MSLLSLDLRQSTDNASKIGTAETTELEDRALIPTPQLPPNGGLEAWLQVVGSFFIFFNAWGIINTYGVYETFYQAQYLSSRSYSAIAWVGSVQTFLCFVGGTATGPVYDAGYSRFLVIAGTLLSVTGMMITSFCTTYWGIFWAQGVVVGLGFGFLFLPSVVIVSQYFTTQKAWATGIASTGSSIGGVVYPIVFGELQPRIGFGWATRVMGFIMLGTSIISIVLLKQRKVKSARRGIFDFGSFTDLPYMFNCLGAFSGFMGIFVVFVYVQLYAIHICGTSMNVAFYLLAIINAGSTFGRLLPNFFADRIGTLNIQILFAFITAGLALALLAINNTPGVILFCALYGFFTGTFVSLSGPTVVSLTTDLSKLGTRMGMSFAFAGAGLLIGSPVAGAISRNGENWAAAQVWCAALLVVSGLSRLTARVLKVGFKLKIKA